MLSNAEKSISFAALRDVLKFSYVVINAKNLLIHTDKDILTISLEIGYSSVNSFINQFKAAYNITPGKFRNNYRKALYT